MIPDKVKELTTEAEAQAYFDNIDNHIATKCDYYVLTTPEITEARKQACSTCEHRGSHFMLDYCDQCTCFIEINTKMANNICPLGKWAE
jgi:hypothetical protein